MSNAAIISDSYPMQLKPSQLELDVQAYGSEMNQSVLDEARSLDMDGREVTVIKTEDPCEDVERRALAAEWISGAEDLLDTDYSVHPHELMYQLPAMKVWREASLGTGLGIFPLYNAKYAETLGEGIDTAIFDEPLFTDATGKKVSAVELVEQNSDKLSAEQALKQHVDVINFPIDEESRVIFSGCEDSVGIRVRSELAKEMALQAVEGKDKSEPLTLVSLGAGSAIPAIKTLQYLEENGYTVEKYHFVDQDPMALATAMSLVRKHGIDEDKIDLHVENLLGSEFNSIDAGSVDVVEAWGLAEYFAPRTATKLFKGAHKLLAEDGSFLYGNMLSDRTQGRYFREIVKWEPKVRLRTLTECVELLDAAGFVNSQVGLPSKNGVYAGFAGRKSTSHESTSDIRQIDPQKVGNTVLGMVKGA